MDQSEREKRDNGGEKMKRERFTYQGERSNGERRDAGERERRRRKRRRWLLATERRRWLLATERRQRLTASGFIVSGRKCWRRREKRRRRLERREESAKVHGE
ncbi:unnamed protein product [Microthlaspi erraticum]|uniref:Uncharacterized protein n=1 Tax=Microthlaspi erraticum TaxID=1685480 RepID=A0A6D2HUY9_9BRAS|nr:unnamed protein product [Microthlaspi erraticum]